MKGIFVNPRETKLSQQAMKPSRFWKFTVLSQAGDESAVGGVLFVNKAVDIPNEIVLKRGGGLVRGEHPVKREGLLYRQF